ncbi:MAG TPA: T9SS type A sorting domain-containing protein [Ignavibacteriaceae bacterium]|nr:T9SS type A sorting domain-containing protein [Ignavibacteriaceae bacterium]
MNKLRIIFLILLLTECVFGTIRYVSKTGSSTPPFTSWETASDSIQKCINICVDGDTIIVANGRYNEALVVNVDLTLIGSSMDSSIIDGTGLWANSRITINANSDLKISGFQIISTNPTIGGSCIFTGNRLEVLNCRITRGKINTYASTPYALLKNLIMDKYVIGSISGDGRVIEIDNCVIIKDMDNSAKCGMDINVDSAKIVNNIVIGKVPGYDYAQGDGISIEILRKAYIANNIVSGFWNNIRATYAVPGYSCVISNNLTCYLYTASYLPSIITVSGIKVYNNILYKVTNGITSDGEDVFGGYNLFWGNTRDTVGGYKIKETDVFADPMFVNDKRPVSLNFDFDFHLQKYSPAIDAGDPTVLDVDGTRSDIGPYGGPYGEEYTYQDLAPRKPYGIVPTINEREVTIKWIRNSEADTSHYVIYRDTVSTFPIDSNHIYRIQKDTLFRDTISEGINKVYYRIQCVDKQGNKGDASDVISFVLSDAGEYKSEGNYDYHLYQNYPNPFNPITKIGYQLKGRGRVKIMIYDIKGELIRQVLNEEKEGGYYETEFDGSGLSSGIYLCRIEIINGKGIPVYMNMRKMVLIK